MLTGSLLCLLKQLCSDALIPVFLRNTELQDLSYRICMMELLLDPHVDKANNSVILLIYIADPLLGTYLTFKYLAELCFIQLCALQFTHQSVYGFQVFVFRSPDHMRSLIQILVSQRDLNDFCHLCQTCLDLLGDLTHDAFRDLFILFFFKLCVNIIADFLRDPVHAHFKV